MWKMWGILRNKNCCKRGEKNLMITWATWLGIGVGFSIGVIWESLMCDCRFGKRVKGKKK